MYYGLLIGSAEFFQLIHTSCKLPYLMFVYIYCEKLEVGLTQEISSELLSGLIQFQVVAYHWFRVTPLVQRKFLVNSELGCK